MLLKEEIKDENEEIYSESNEQENDAFDASNNETCLDDIQGEFLKKDNFDINEKEIKSKDNETSQKRKRKVYKKTNNKKSAHKKGKKGKEVTAGSNCKLEFDECKPDQDVDSISTQVPTDHSDVGLKKWFEKRQSYASCSKCGVHFPRKHSLVKHMYIVHQERGDNPVCDKCNMIFMDSASFEKHKQIVHEQTVFTCNHCGKDFDNNNTRRQCEATHRGRRGCKICGKRFPSGHSLEVSYPSHKAPHKETPSHPNPPTHSHRDPSHCSRVHHGDLGIPIPVRNLFLFGV